MRPRFTFDSLQPGMGFGFSGPRRLFLFSGGVAVGQIVGLEQHNGIVHVRTFRPGSDAIRQRPEIGLIPILFSAFQRSVRFLQGLGPVPQDVWPHISAWRQRHASHEVGAFSPTLWRVEELIWQAVKESSPASHSENTYVEYAFPTGHAGNPVCSAVEVSCVPIVPAGTA